MLVSHPEAQIRLEGYKLARTKPAAALALGCLLAAHPGALPTEQLQVSCSQRLQPHGTVSNT